MNLDNYIVEATILWAVVCSAAIGFFIYLIEKERRDL